MYYSRILAWARHIAPACECSNAFKIITGKPKGNALPGRSRMDLGYVSIWKIGLIRLWITIIEKS